MKSENLTPHIPVRETPQHKVCVDCPTLERSETAKRAQLIRLDLTLGLNLPRVAMPDMYSFHDLTGIRENLAAIRFRKAEIAMECFQLGLDTGKARP